MKNNTINHFKCCIVILSIFLCCGCGKKPLPVPAYPVDQAAIEAALEKANLSWTVKEQKPWMESMTVYTLYNEDDKWIADVISEKSEERYLFIGFVLSSPAQEKISVRLSEEDWEKAVIFGTVLYGGFAHEDQVYEEFADYLFTQKEPAALPENSAAINETNAGRKSTWSAEINEIRCEITLSRPAADSSETDFYTLIFSHANP